MANREKKTKFMIPAERHDEFTKAIKDFEKISREIEPFLNKNIQSKKQPKPQQWTLTCDILSS